MLWCISILTTLVMKMENTFSITFQFISRQVLWFSLAYFAHRQQWRSKISLENSYKDSPLRMSMKYASEFSNNTRNRTRKWVLITTSHGNQGYLLLLQLKTIEKYFQKKFCLLFRTMGIIHLILINGYYYPFDTMNRKGIKMYPLKYLYFILKETEMQKMDLFPKITVLVGSKRRSNTQVL